MSVHESLKSLPEWGRLLELVRELAFLDGGSDDAFTLASGRSSRWFFDMKPLMMHSEASKLLAVLFNHRLDALNPDFVGGLELGAVPLTTIVITGSQNHHRKGFMVRKSPKGRGGRKTNNPPGIEGASLAAGGSVIVLEDVTTTGGSSIQAVERIRETTSCDVLGVISILDRQEGGVEAFAEAGIPFESIFTRSDIAQ